MTALRHSYWTFSSFLRHTMDPEGNIECNEEVGMHKRAHSFHWSYLFQLEDSTTPEHSALARTCKSMLWIGVSVLMGMGVGQLT